MHGQVRMVCSMKLMHHSLCGLWEGQACGYGCGKQLSDRYPEVVNMGMGWICVRNALRVLKYTMGDWSVMKLGAGLSKISLPWGVSDAHSPRETRQSLGLRQLE